MSTLECVKCKAKSQLYLCPLCITELRRQFLRLPTMLGYLHDAAYSQTRLGGDESRSPGFRSRTYSVNGSAVDLITEIDNTVGQWARALARKYGLMISPPVTWHRPWDQYTHTTKDYALFLAGHVKLLAKDPDVGDLVFSLRQYVRRSTMLVNRRVPAQFCGPCPTLITDHRRCVDRDGAPTCSKRDHECSTRLMAPRGAPEVRCPSCGATRRAEALVNHLLARSDDYRCTIPEMYRVLRMLGEPVKMRTLQHWVKAGRLRPAGYLRPDKRRIAPTRHDKKDTPVYRISDTRKARQDAPAGRGKYVRTKETREKTSRSLSKDKQQKKGGQ